MTDTAVAPAPEIQRYVDSVEARLASLSDDERSELLADFVAHLWEIQSDESDGDIADRIGTPDEYADEFVASIGLDVAPAPRQGVWDGLRGSARRMKDHPTTGRLRSWMAPMESAWWGISGFLIGMAVSWNWLGLGLTAPPFDMRVAAVALVFGCVVVSANIGSRRRRSRLWGWTAIALTAGAIVAGAFLVTTTNHTLSAYYYEPAPTVVGDLEEATPDELRNLYDEGWLDFEEMQHYLEGGIVQSGPITSLPSDDFDALAVYPAGYEVYADFGITPDQLYRMIAAGLMPPTGITPLPPDAPIVVTP